MTSILQAANHVILTYFVSIILPMQRTMIYIIPILYIKDDDDIPLGDPAQYSSLVIWPTTV